MSNPIDNFKVILLERISNISFGNIAHEVILDIEKQEGVALSVELVDKMLAIGESISIQIDYESNLPVENGHSGPFFDPPTWA